MTHFSCQINLHCAAIGLLPNKTRSDLAEHGMRTECVAPARDTCSAFLPARALVLELQRSITAFWRLLTQAARKKRDSPGSWIGRKKLTAKDSVFFSLLHCCPICRKFFCIYFLLDLCDMFGTSLMKRSMSRALHLLWRYVAMKGMLIVVLRGRIKLN